MLDPNPGLIVWTILVFLMLVVVLRKIAWKPLLQALHDREEGIRSALERSEQARHDAERLLEENRKQLARAEAESQRILSEGRALGEKLKDEIVQKAHEQSQRILTQAKEEIGRDKDAAINQLRVEVANLAIQAAEKILDENLDETKQRKIVDSFLKNLPKN